MRKTVFFDRDGVLNVEKNYLYKIEEFQWQVDAVAAIKLLQAAGYQIIVVTNQSGIARGYYNEVDVQKLHAYMQAQLALEQTKIDAFYYCPHLPTGSRPEYTKECQCRKPRPGMLQAAMQEYPVLEAQSFLIGDKTSDLQAAQAAGIRGYLYQTGSLLEFVKNVLVKEAGLVNGI